MKLKHNKTPTYIGRYYFTKREQIERMFCPLNKKLLKEKVYYPLRKEM